MNTLFILLNQYCYKVWQYGIPFTNQGHSLALCFVLSFSGVIVAQTPGSLDTSFNPNDVGFGIGDGFNSPVNTVTRQADGKILVGGIFNQYNSNTINGLVRLNPDGTLDKSFNTGSGFNGSVNTIELQSDGKILVGGHFQSYNDVPAYGIVRLNEDGSLDVAFNIQQKLIYYNGTGSISSITIQADNKILLQGLFNSYDDIPMNGIARLNSDGSLDTDFNTDFNNLVDALALQSDGKILVVGGFSKYGETNLGKIARLHTDGSLDMSFAPESGFAGRAFAMDIALQPDGKALVTGFFEEYNNVNRAGMVRINTDGSIDTSFDPGTGIEAPFTNFTTAFISDFILQNDGKILATGDFNSYNGVSRPGIVRINTNGSVDTSFDPGNGFNIWGQSLYLQSDGKVIIGGGFTSYDEIPYGHIIRLNQDGSIDNSIFPVGTAFNGSVYQINIQSDHKIVASGDFNGYDGVVQRGLVKLNPNGSKDVSFDIGTGFEYRQDPGVVFLSITQPDGKIIAGGFFDTFNGINRISITRLNNDGSLDATFDPGDSFGTEGLQIVYSLALQPDGKILVGGLFNNYNGVALSGILRLNPDGSLDNSFNTGTGFIDEINFYPHLRSIIVQPDGKILVGGQFTSFNGVSRNGIARLNPDGSLDAGFNPTNGLNAERLPIVHNTALQADGKVLVVGGFSDFNGISRNGILRLNSDGSLDTSFDPGNGFEGWGASCLLKPDGKILVGGSFSSYNGIAQSNIVQLHPDGSIDTDFDTGLGFNGELFPTVFDMHIQEDGNILAVGSFTSFNGIGRNRIARLFGDKTYDASITSLVLVNADTNEDIMPLTEGIVIDPIAIGTNNLSVRAISNPSSVGSVGFELDGPISINRVENMAPYALFGDSNNGQDYAGRTFLPGKYTLTVKPFEQTLGQGAIGTPLTINFEILPTLILVNADTDEDIMSLSQGLEIDLSTLNTANFSIRTSTLPAGVESVEFSLNGLINQNKVESIAPFALFGDSPKGDYIGKIFRPGQYSIQATLYPLAAAEGEAIQTVNIDFTISTGESLAIGDLVLVNADTEQDIQTITDGAVIELSDLATTNLTIRANTNPGIVGSVDFELTGAMNRTQTENLAPYTLFGDQSNGQDYLGGIFSAGQYNLSATPYGLAFTSGTQGQTKTISFTLAEGSMVNIYPNVTSNEVTIDLQNSTEASLEITDHFGQVIQESMTIQNGAKINLQNQKSGTYLMIFKIGNELITKQVVVIK